MLLGNILRPKYFPTSRLQANITCPIPFKMVNNIKEHILNRLEVEHQDISNTLVYRLIFKTLLCTLMEMFLNINESPSICFHSSLSAQAILTCHNLCIKLPDFRCTPDVPYLQQFQMISVQPSSDRDRLYSVISFHIFEGDSSTKSRYFQHNLEDCFL